MSRVVSAFEIVVTLAGLKEDVSCPSSAQSSVWQLKRVEMEKQEMKEERWDTVNRVK